MKSTSLAALLLLFVAGWAGAAERTREQTFTYSLLTSEELPYVVMGAKSVERTPTLGPDALDVTAAVLAERAAKPDASGPEIDASAWLMRALGTGGQARFRGTIEQAVAAYRNEKIDKYAQLALTTMTQGDATPPTRIDLAALRAQLQAERDAMHGMDSAPVSSIVVGTPLESVLERFGYPERISQTSRTAGYSYVRVTSHAVRLHYRDVGTVDAGYGNDGHGWTVTRFLPPLGDAYTGDYEGEAAALSTGDTRALVHVATSLLKAGVREPQLLDLVAARIRQSMGTHDVYEVTAVARLCRVLGVSGDRKYLPLLQEVSDKGADSALRRHARRALDDMLKS